VETTTGPLGQGVANAVGMAMAARYKRNLLDPKAEPGSSPFDHDIWVICSDGDLQEGVSAEASSLAGTQQLGALKVIYDDNRISIDGDTHQTFTEDVSARYRAYGWQVLEVAAKADGDVDREALESAMTKARATVDRPTLIRLKTIIAWPAPKARNTAKSHGAALGSSEIAATKEILGLPAEDFYYPNEIENHLKALRNRNDALRANWDESFATWQRSNSDAARLLARLGSNSLPTDWESALPNFSSDKEVATRKASGEVINALAKLLPELIGGSADLAESNNTMIEGGGAFLPRTSTIAGANPAGRNIFYGIREHAMGAIMNGIALHGGVRPFGGTFLVFSDYMRGAVRLSALMKLPVTYVWTHDSIGLGEDGPTHQPVEHIAALRAIPGFDVIRPADANEVSVVWGEIIRRRRPCGLLLSRQNLPVFDRNNFASASGAARGAYVLSGATNPEVLLIATGSEVSLALEAATLLASDGIAAQVISAPSLEWFSEQGDDYKQAVLPPHIKARVSIEAGIAQGWREYVGDHGECISLDHFGASASHTTLFKEFGFTAAAVVAAAKRTIAKVK